MAALNQVVVVEPQELYVAFFSNLQANREAMPRFLQDVGLIPREGAYPCPKCAGQLKLMHRSASLDGWTWYCSNRVAVNKQKAKKCGKEISFRSGTFFGRSKLELWQILGFVNLWVESAALTLIRQQVQISFQTAVDWASFCREVVLFNYLRNPIKLGGPGMIVEIDESKFGCRKYHRGHRVEGQRVFGGYEKSTGRVLMVAVEFRDAATLIPIIRDWIEPGTTIISDFWKAYDCLETEGYTHLKVNHSICFKDPDTGAHTNSIESSWRAAKSSMSSSGRIKAHIPGNLARYLFLKRCRTLNLDKTREFFRLAGNMYNPALTGGADAFTDEDLDSDDEDFL